MPDIKIQESLCYCGTCREAASTGLAIAGKDDGALCHSWWAQVHLAAAFAHLSAIPFGHAETAAMYDQHVQANVTHATTTMFNNLSPMEAARFKALCDRHH